MTVFEGIREILVEELTLKPELVKLESKLNDDLGADSLDRAEIMLALEGKFGVDIPEEETKEITTVSDIVKLVNKKLQAKTTSQP